MYISAGPLGLWACGTALSSILHSSLFPIVVLSSPCTLFPLPYCVSLVLLVVLFPLPWRTFPVFLGGQIAYFPGGG